jgi:ComF family protein
MKFLRAWLEEANFVGRSVMGLLLAPLCVVCGAGLRGRAKWVCPACAGAIVADQRPRLRLLTVDGRELRIRYALDYTPAVASLIREMKYTDKPGIAGMLAGLVWATIGGDIAGDLVFVPVPLHPARRRQRGYNQSELLARKLAHLACARARVRGLARTRNTPAQAALGREERLHNVVGSFRARDVAGMASHRVMIVDDVVTTGATLKECARALYDAGLEEVEACAIASRDS